MIKVYSRVLEKKGRHMRNFLQAHIKFTFSTLLLLFFAFNLNAKNLKLDSALMAAYQNNPTLLAERAKLRSTDEGVPQALANWRPDISISTGASYSDVLSTNSTGSSREQWRNSHSYGIDITQSLYRGGRTAIQIEEAENNVLADRAGLMDTEQTVFLEVISAFMDVFREKAVLELNIENENVLKRQLEATSDRFQVGEITQTDVNQAEARLAQASADRVKSEGDLEVSRSIYLNVVGEPAPGELSEVIIPTKLPKSKEEALKIAAVKNPKVIRAEFSRLAALNNVDDIRGELFPELTLTGSWDRAFEGSAEQGRVDTAKVSLDLSIPIYQQGAVYSRLRQAKQQVTQKAFLLDKERRNAIQNASKSWESLKSAKAQVSSFNAQIEANVVALEGVQREASVGSRTVLDVLDAEQELRDSRVSHIRARRDELVAMYELKASLGQLTARAIGLPVQLYDHRVHYKEIREKWIGSGFLGGKN